MRFLERSFKYARLFSYRDYQCISNPFEFPLKYVGNSRFIGNYDYDGKQKNRKTTIDDDNNDTQQQPWSQSYLQGWRYRR